MQYPLSRLTIDLEALKKNYSILKDRLHGGECAAVVKANAYGLGIKQIGQALYQQGCRHFFVAYLDEAIALRSSVKDAGIYVFHGLNEGEETAFWEYHITPVLNTLKQIELWQKLTRLKGNLPYVLNIDTGMNRLGLSAKEARHFSELSNLSSLKPTIIMSHLACAGEKKDPVNEIQLNLFKEMAALFPESQHCLSNSSGIFLGSNYHFDMARPGCALYGVNPAPHLKKNPMCGVVSLQGKILQIRDVKKNEAIGYDATFKAKKNMQIAVVSVGYADGYFRCLGNKGYAYIGDEKLNVVGRVSMDLITIDVTSVSSTVLEQTTHVELLGKHFSVDELAKKAGTIGYEVLTQLGSRYQRIYLGV